MQSEGRCPGQNCEAGCSEVVTGCHGNTGAPAEDRCQWCVVWPSGALGYGCYRWEIPRVSSDC